MKILLNINQATNEKLDHELSKINDLEINRIRCKSKTTLINYLLDKALKDFETDDYLNSLVICKNKYHLNYRKFKNKEIMKNDI